MRIIYKGGGVSVVKEAIDIMHVITINLDESYSSEVVRKEAKPLIDVFNSISDNYNAIYLFDNLNGDYVTTIRIGLDVRGIIEYSDDADYINTPPNISNEKMKMSYDKSLYCACRYLADTKATHLDKSGYILSHLTDVDTFFNGISDFKSIKFEQALIKAEQKVMKEIEAENRDLNDGRTGLNIKTSKLSRSAIKNRANKIVGGHKVGKIHGRRK